LMSEAVTTRRAKRARPERATRRAAGKRQPAGWLLGLGASVLVHLGILVAFVCYGRSSEPIETATDPLGGPWTALALAPMAVPVEVTAIAETELPPADAPPPLARPWDAPAGERDNPIARTRAPAVGDSRDREAPAPDSGPGGGAPLDRAFRLDRSTLRSRLTDGAAEAQPARLRISRRRASPQAIRREPTVGIGDSVRTVVPSRAPISLANAAADPALEGEPAGAARAAAPATLSEAQPLVARVDPDPNAAHAIGPLDAEAGRRAFDIQEPGRAADNRTQRTASDELHPGITDFSRAAAPQPVAFAEGRGPSESPGAVSRPAAGTAAAALGARNPRELGREVDERTIDRRYDRYIEEIRQRVRRIREFPRSLAVRLLEGETIVAFVVDVNGRLGDGPRVIKSSGFEEFDAAAVRAVRRAAPFPPMPDPAKARPLSVSLRVIFDNPVVR
ncbi:MAG TPA: TonB family protein, partial [Polyangia bacterium]|nr:TonB family protein [Polyangia bacterium]